MVIGHGVDMIQSIINKFSDKPLYAFGVYAGLFLPDIDLLLLPILFHRSIVTHSILLILLIKPFMPKPFSQGLLLGVGCHLIADSTGAMVGFGMIWLPIVIMPIGPALSLIWIIVNASLCLYYCYINTPINKLTFCLIILGTLGLSAVTAGTAAYALAIIGFVVFVKLALTFLGTAIKVPFETYKNDKSNKCDLQEQEIAQIFETYKNNKANKSSIERRDSE